DGTAFRPAVCEPRTREQRARQSQRRLFVRFDREVVRSADDRGAAHLPRRRPRQVPSRGQLTRRLRRFRARVKTQKTCEARAAQRDDAAVHVDQLWCWYASSSWRRRGRALANDSTRLSRSPETAPENPPTPA